MVKSEDFNNDYGESISGLSNSVGKELIHSIDQMISENDEIISTASLEKASSFDEIGKAMKEGEF